MPDHRPHHDEGPVLGTVIEAPWGPIHLATTTVGVVAVDLMATATSFSDGLERRLGRTLAWTETGDRTDLAGPAHRHLRTAAEALSRALDGDDASIDELALDLVDRPAWDRAVLGAVRAIPRGETSSYGQIAQAIGRPGAARAVGGAVGRNPIGFIIPCHRVIAGDGTLGGYGGGWWGDRDRLLQLKAELLAREGRRVRRSPSRSERAR